MPEFLPDSQLQVVAPGSCQHLPPELLFRVLACLPGNQQACTARLVCKAAAAALNRPQHATIHLSQPSPHGEFVRRWGKPGAMRPLTLARRHLLLSLTAASGCLENLQWLAERVGCSLVADVFEAAAGAGRVAVCRWLQRQGCVGQWQALNAAAGTGQRSVVERLLVQGSPMHAACAAARGGHVGLMDWLLQRCGPRCSWGSPASLLEGAAEGCDLPTLQRLHDTCQQGEQPAAARLLTGTLAAAAGSPTPDWRAKALHAYFSTAFASAAWSAAVSLAARAGQLPVVAWLLEVEVGDPGETLALEACHMEAAAESGSVELLAWLRRRGCPWHLHTFGPAAVAGSEEALEWLATHGCPMTEPDGRWPDPYLVPAIREDWRTLACVRRLGCPWQPNGGTFTSAVLDCRCSLPALRWLLRLGCPMDWQRASKAAARRRDPSAAAPAPYPCGRSSNAHAFPTSPPPALGIVFFQRCRPNSPPWQDGTGRRGTGSLSRLQVVAPGSCQHLPPELVFRVLACLPSNRQACAARLVCKAAAAALSGPQHTTIHLSQPSPHSDFVRRWGKPGAMRPLTLARRHLLLSLTAASGCLENLQWLAERVGCSLVADVFVAAAGAGRLEVCRWLKQQGCDGQLTALNAAAEAGQRSVVERLLRHGSTIHAACAAARGGHVGLMDWLLQRCGPRCSWGSPASLLEGAAEGCDLPTLQRLHGTYVQGGHPAAARLPTGILAAAAGSPTPDWEAKVEWLEGLGAAATSSHEACTRAASCPDALDRLTWLRARGYQWDWQATRAAAVAGNVGALRYLLAEGCDVADGTFAASAGAGQLASLQALHAHFSTAIASAAWSAAVSSAARAGQLPVVAWLLEVEVGDPGETLALEACHMEAAAESGSVELLAWLRRRGCPWHLHTFGPAAVAGSEEALEWLTTHGCPMTEPDGRWPDPYLAPAIREDWRTLACVRRLGCPWQPDGGTFTSAVQDCRCSAPALRWLLELGCPAKPLREKGHKYDGSGASEFKTSLDQRPRGPMAALLPETMPDVDDDAAEPAVVAAATSWQDLPPDLLPLLLSGLTHNELACNLRLSNKAAAAAFSSPQHTTVRLSLPSPHGEFARRWGGPGGMRPLTLVRRRQLLCLTAASGCLENLAWLVERAGCALSDKSGGIVFSSAAVAGRLDVCQWLQQQGCQEGLEWTLSEAAGAGQQSVVEWLLANGHSDAIHAIRSAARHGHVGLMDWLLQRHGLGRGRGAAATFLTAAAVGCDLPTLQRLHHTYLPDDPPTHPPAPRQPLQPPARLLMGVLAAAAGSPTPDWAAKVEWLEELGVPASSPEVCAMAASHPDALDRLTWLKGRGYPLDRPATHQAAMAGNVSALRYLLAEGCPVNNYTLESAAGAGQLAALQAFHAHGGAFTPAAWSGAVASAAREGHLQVVAWLLEAQLVAAEWLVQDGAGVLTEAARSGSMELLAWLRERGCPWSGHVLAAAAEAGSEEALEWLVAQGCPVPEPGGADDPYTSAAHQGDWGTLICLHRLGCPWQPRSGVFARAVGERWPLPVLSRLLELGCPVDWQAALEAAAVASGDASAAFLPPQQTARRPRVLPVALRASTRRRGVINQASTRQRGSLGARARVRAEPQLQATSPALDAAVPWQDLPPELLPHLLACLPPNERACTARLVCKAATPLSSGPQHTTVRLSQPSPRGEFVRRWGGPGAMRPLTLTRRRLLLSLTAASGCLENLQWLAESAGCSLSIKAMEAAAAAGQVEVCRWLQQQGCGVGFGALEAAAGAGQRSVVEWLLIYGQGAYTRGDGSDGRTNLACGAARGGHVGLMDWLLQRFGLGRGAGWVAALLEAAAEGCDLPTLQRLYHCTHRQGEQPPVEVLKGIVGIAAAAAGSPTPDWQAKVEWLEELCVPASSSDACAKAASRPDALDRLTWLRGRGYPWGWQATEAAAAAGNVGALRYLLAEGCPVDKAMFGAAAGAGQLVSLQALHEHRAGIHPNRWYGAFKPAARAGHLPVMSWLYDTQLVAPEWLVENGTGMLTDAARLGSVEMLAWLRERGCVWDDRILIAAAEAGSQEAIEWLVAQGYPTEEPGGAGDDPYIPAALQGDWATLACLHRLGCPWQPSGVAFTSAARWGQVPVLRRLLELGCPVDWQAALGAAEESGDASVWAWLEEQRDRVGGPLQQ
ncbi:Ankyrin repeat domain-containing protein [Tetrabaena socialis]|uniref:Ankyrin repeat domain-containing protein n=1 Tax=Tetrabaena socialis TaxID=47790 RepID=A0A2J8A5H4_9CHLO|nr:Ankyrin repeat domain-containing protein [Tetrabaena socialis]|eukprot:PNH07776.1 Ankyrin repeat domain-containing protein [Tetrabaena socialis]